MAAIPGEGEDDCTAHGDCEVDRQAEGSSSFGSTQVGAPSTLTSQGFDAATAGSTSRIISSV